MKFKIDKSVLAELINDKRGLYEKMGLRVLV